MSISAIINIAREYLIIGVALIAILFFIGYFVVYKKLLKGRKKLKVSKVALWSTFFVYIIVVLGATLGIRSSGYEGSMNLHLFSSYIEAYNSFSKVSWRNIILNILMFVPLGIILPLIFRKCRKFWVTYLVGFLSTVLLEVIQLVTKRGIFEFDDIFNNTLGCVIGYGIIMIILLGFMDKKRQLKNKSLSLICLQIPLCVTIIAFSTIFINYSNKELGNLSIKYNYRKDMSNINISTKQKFNNNEEKAYVYKATVGSYEESLEVANEIFSTVNTDVDESQNDIYDDTIVYRSSDGNYLVWVNYTGLTTWYTDYTQMDISGKDGLSYEKVKSLLKDFSIDLPEKAEFKNDGEGNYTISVDMIENDGVYLDGELRCTIKENGTLSDFSNNIISYKKYKEYEIISEEKAYDKILKGEFKDDFLEENSKIEIKDVNLSYEMDSKGFYQPVYKFTVEGLSRGTSILIPALK